MRLLRYCFSSDWTITLKSLFQSLCCFGGNFFVCFVLLLFFKLSFQTTGGLLQVVLAAFTKNGKTHYICYTDNIHIACFVFPSVLYFSNYSSGSSILLFFHLQVRTRVDLLTSITSFCKKFCIWLCTISISVMNLSLVVYTDGPCFFQCEQWIINSFHG